MSELYDGSDWGDTSGISNTQSDDGYNYWTDPSVSNLDANTGLSQSYNGEDWGDITDAILNGEVNPTPSSSLTPNSSTLASPNLFSQLFSGVGKALSTPATANQSSLGQLFGNLASRVIQPLAQGNTGTPGTQNLNSVTPKNAITSLLSNPLVIIGGIVLLVVFLKK